MSKDVVDIDLKANLGIDGKNSINYNPSLEKNHHLSRFWFKIRDFELKSVLN